MSKRKTTRAPREHDDEWEMAITQIESELLRTTETCDIDARPLVAKTMNAYEVANFVSVIASVQKCKEDDVSFRCEPLFDDAGNVLLTEILLIFSTRSLVDGILNDRTVHSLRVQVPQEIQQCAKSMQQRAMDTMRETKGN